MSKPIRVNRTAAVFAAAICIVPGAIAGAADVSGGADGVSLSGVSPNAQNVRISGPDGYVADGTRLADGDYHYEVVETRCESLSWAEIDAATRDNAANGRAPDAQPSNCREVVVDSGSFRIVNGAVPDNALSEE